MNFAPRAHMIEAARLTREGRLAEAAEVIRRALGAQPVAESSAARGRVEPDSSGPIIDMSPSVAGCREVWTAAPGGSVRPSSLSGGVREPESREPPAQALSPRRWLDGLAGKLATALPGRAAVPSQKPVPVPPGARFVEASYLGAAGTLAYKLYIPGSYRGEPLPLIVMLHGCTQSPDDFAAGTRMNSLAEERGFLVLYPAQSKVANASKCWNWFNTADQSRGKGEPALIAGAVGQVTRDYAVDRRRVYAAGLSAGGAAATILGATYPDLFAAVGVHSGLPCGVATDLPSALQAMQTGGSGHRPLPRIAAPVIVFHGDRDRTVNPRNGDAVIEQATPVGGNAPPQTARGETAGRSYTRHVFTDASGAAALEHWVIHGAGHAWSGGSPAGSYTDPTGPDASREMLRFFLDHELPAA